MSSLFSLGRGRRSPYHCLVSHRTVGQITFWGAQAEVTRADRLSGSVANCRAGSSQPEMMGKGRPPGAGLRATFSAFRRRVLSGDRSATSRPLLAYSSCEAEYAKALELHTVARQRVLAVWSSPTVPQTQS